MRSGEPWERLKRSLELCAEAGADILSIESIGGKEVHDQALMYGDFPGIVFALGVLAPRDMSWLWEQIGKICAAHPGVGQRRPTPPADLPTPPCSLPTRRCCPKCWRQWCGP